MKNLFGKLKFIGFLFSMIIFGSYAQQGIQYTQYMFNTMVINPAYTGTKGFTSIGAMYRKQWLSVEGAPETMSLFIDGPMSTYPVGFGLSIVHDREGPANQTFVNANFSYHLRLSMDIGLAFGLKAGGNFLNVDFSNWFSKDRDDVSLVNAGTRFLPDVGVGSYAYSDKWYAGVSFINLLKTNHYNNVKQSVITENIHLYLTGGYMFDLSDNVKFKPAALSKIVLGLPLTLDLSANFLFYERFMFGTSWRMGDSISALINTKITKKLWVGYAFDYTFSLLGKYGGNTHEIMIIYNLKTRPVKSSEDVSIVHQPF